MFLGPAVAVPYAIDDVNGSEWLFVEPRDRWKDILWDWMNVLVEQDSVP